jgi:hypothetical protein
VAAPKPLETPPTSTTPALIIRGPDCKPICVPCPIAFCCLCDASGNPNHFCFAVTGDSGVFDHNLGQTATALLNHIHTGTDTSGQFDPFREFDPCCWDGGAIMFGTSIIGGKPTCYEIGLWFGFWCDESGFTRVVLLGPMYYEAWENDYGRYLRFGPHYSEFTDYLFAPVREFEDLGVLNWECVHGVWSAKVTFTRTLAWTDPRTGGSHSIPVTWHLQINGYDSATCPPHDNPDDPAGNSYTPRTIGVNYYEAYALDNPLEPACQIRAPVDNPDPPDYGLSDGLTTPANSTIHRFCTCIFSDQGASVLVMPLPSTTTPSGNCATCTITSGTFHWLRGIGPAGEHGYQGIIDIKGCTAPDLGGTILLQMICLGDGTWTARARSLVRGGSTWVDLSVSFTDPCVDGTDSCVEVRAGLSRNSPQCPDDVSRMGQRRRHDRRRARST